MLAVLTLLWASGAVSAQPRKSTVYWQGTLRVDNRTWDVGLEWDPAEKPPAVFLDMAATYTAHTPPDTLVVRGDHITFDLPFSLGLFDGERRSDEIAGLVKLETGATVPLRLRRSARASIRMEDFTVENDDTTIAATLALPTEPGRYPLAILLHGGGDSTRENVWFFADYFARAGIACVIYDKRGNGKSTGDWRTVGFEPRARDVTALLEKVRRHPEVDASKTGLVAVSQGAWVGGIAADLDPEVAFIVNVSGPAVSVVEADTYSILTSLRQDEWAQNAIEERLHLWDLRADVARHPDSDAAWSRLQTAIDSVRTRSWFQSNPYEPSRDSWFTTWYHHVLDHDPVPILRCLDIPILWIYGERDTESDAIHNIAILNRLRREEGKQYRIEVFEATAHGLVGPVDRLGRDLGLSRVAPGYLELLVNWIRAQTGASID